MLAKVLFPRFHWLLDEAAAALQLQYRLYFIYLNRRNSFSFPLSPQLQFDVSSTFVYMTVILSIITYSANQLQEL
jgi:hypothetical protein